MGLNFLFVEHGCCPFLVVGESIGFGPETDRAKAMARTLRNSDCTRVVHRLQMIVVDRRKVVGDREVGVRLDDEVEEGLLDELRAGKNQKV